MIKYLCLFLTFFLLSCLPSTDTLVNNSNTVEIINDIPGFGNRILNHYKITAHYIGTLEDGKEFDNSYKKNKPLIFQFGLNQVIPGLEMGIKDMREGGKRKLKISPNLAYGKKGVKNIIPPNSTLLFEIEILNIEPHKYFLITSDILKNIKKEMLINSSKNNIILVDIRNFKKTKHKGLIKSSIKIEAFDINFNLNANFLTKINSIYDRKDDHLILIGENGDSSSILANGLVENIGMTYVYSLKNGVSGWVDLGYKLEN